MIALIRLDPPEIVRVYSTTPARVELPGVGQVSPAVIGWEGGGTDDTPLFRIVAVTRAEVPEGKVTIGAPAYAIAGDAVVESYTLADAPPQRWTVSTKTIVRRTIEAGMAAEAVALLRQHPDLEFRFITAGEIWCDDPPTLTMLAALGLDPAVILASET